MSLFLAVSGFFWDGPERGKKKGWERPGRVPGPLGKIILVTPPKTNMEPQNEGLEDVFPFQMGDFQVPC